VLEVLRRGRFLR